MCTCDLPRSKAELYFLSFCEFLLASVLKILGVNKLTRLRCVVASNINALYVRFGKREVEGECFNTRVLSYFVSNIIDIFLRKT